MQYDLMRGAWGIDDNGDAFRHVETIQFEVIGATARAFVHPSGRTVERVVYDLQDGTQVTQVLEWGPDRRLFVAYLEWPPQC